MSWAAPDAAPTPRPGNALDADIGDPSGAYLAPDDLTSATDLDADPTAG